MIRFSAVIFFLLFSLSLSAASGSTWVYFVFLHEEGKKPEKVTEVLMGKAGLSRREVKQLKRFKRKQVYQNTDSEKALSVLRALSQAGALASLWVLERPSDKAEDKVEDNR